MNCRDQKVIVDSIFRDNLKNIFLESWEPYNLEKRKLEEVVVKYLNKRIPQGSIIESVKYIQQENYFKMNVREGKITYEIDFIHNFK